MPPKIFKKEAPEKTTTTERTKEQSRRVRDSDDDDLSSEEERGRIIGAKEEVKSDDELSKFDLTDGSEEVVANTLERQRPITLFRAALAKYPAAAQFATQAQLSEYLWNMGAKYSTSVRLSEILKRGGKTCNTRYNLGHVTSKEAQFCVNHLLALISPEI